jgi:rhodanese-related sulfurtransferase
MQQILAEGTNTRPLVVIDHQGRQALDAAAYFMGHGLTNVYCLRGGIDAWSQEIDPKLPRYRLG